MNMYNDEQNLYHYTYRKDGSESAPKAENNAAPQEPIHPQSAGPQGPVQEMKPVKKNRMGNQRLRQQFQHQRQQPGGYPGGH